MFHIHRYIAFDLLWVTFCINCSLLKVYGDLTEAEMLVSRSDILIDGLVTSLFVRPDKSCEDINRLRESSCTITASVRVSVRTGI